MIKIEYIISMLSRIVKNIIPVDCGGLIINAIMQCRLDKKIAEKNNRKIDYLLRGSYPIMLELGAGHNRRIPGWTYVDLNEECDLNLDLVQPLPFPDESVDKIYSSHLLEHFKYDDLLNLLKECLRILRPGGDFSAAVPNARIYLDAYHNPDGFDPDLFCRHLPAFKYNSKIDYVNYMAYMAGQHSYMFDEQNLVVILERIGFKSVSLREYDKDLDMAVRNFQTIYVHCEK